MSDLTILCSTKPAPIYGSGIRSALLPSPLDRGLKTVGVDQRMHFPRATAPPLAHAVATTAAAGMVTSTALRAPAFLGIAKAMSK